MSEVNPNVGDFVLFRSNGSYERVTVEVKQAAKVSPRLVKFVGTSYPRQCSILEVVASFPDEATALRVKDSIAGVAGEFSRRRRAAEAERTRRVTDALTAANRTVEEIIARESIQ